MAIKNYLGNQLIKLGSSFQGNKKQSGQVGVILDKLKEERIIWRQEISDWQMGREAFYDIHHPVTCTLQEVYHDVMLDDQLTTVTEDRNLRLLNKKLVVFGADRKEDEKKSEWLNDQEWLFDFLQEALNSIYYGYSLMWLKPIRTGTGKLNFESQLVPRGFVSPKNNLILQNENDPFTGVRWDKYPKELMYCQMYGNVGLLEKAAPMTILKRHSWGSWDEFEQIFGIPIRIAKYALGNEKLKKEMGSWLEEMGKSAWGVFPKEAEIQIVENQKADAFNVFLKKIERVDQGLSKLILHQTGTTDEKAFVGSAEVHQNTLEQVTMADERKLGLILNRLVTKLAQWGLLDGSETIGFKKTINPSKQITVDSQLMSGGVRFTKDYLERTYGVEVETVDPNALDPKKKD